MGKLLLVKETNITGCLLDYAYFRDNFEMVVEDLSKQQALRADNRIIQ